ncbi:MAG: helix-turn-helix transcriptional regulator [Elusimicrobiota bacterium]
MRPAGHPSFSRLVGDALAARGLGLREFCRRADLDPSFFSKVLAGKRNPPSDESALRRLAEVLGLSAVEIIVAAGRIPTDWHALCSDPDLLSRVHAIAVRAGDPRPARKAAVAVRAVAPGRVLPPSGGLAEELL